MWKIRHALREEATGGETGGAGGGTAQPAAAPAAAPAPAAGAPAGAPAAAAPAAPAAAPAPAAKGAPAAATAPAAAGKEGKEGEGNNEAYWPPDWRKTVSKDDAKVLARLERYASPEAAMQALIAAQNRIAAGELKPVLGKNATPEQVAEYRAALGIPEAPDKYDLGKDAAGIAPELLSPVLKHAHETNQTPEQVKATLKAWSEIQANVAEQRADNIHVHEGVTEAQFVSLRTARDKTLAMPVLILPAVQVNVRAGHLPPPESNGVRYLKIPVNLL